MLENNKTDIYRIMRYGIMRYCVLKFGLGKYIQKEEKS